MSPGSEPAFPFPDPRHDPEFAPDGPARAKSEGGWPSPESSRARDGKRGALAARRRSGILALVLGLVWLGLLLDPTIGLLLLALLAAFGLALAVMAGAMALGMMGVGLFAVGDRVLAWCRRGTQWPEG
jgi:hypothetical protein